MAGHNRRFDTSSLAPSSEVGSHSVAAPSAPRSVTAWRFAARISAVARQPEIEAQAGQTSSSPSAWSRRCTSSTSFAVVFVFVFAAKSITA